MGKTYCKSLACYFFGLLTSHDLLFCSSHPLSGSQIDIILQNCYITEILTSIPHNLNFIETSNNLTHSFIQYLVGIYQAPGMC